MGDMTVVSVVGRERPFTGAGLSSGDIRPPSRRGEQEEDPASTRPVARESKLF